jgi:hypothetical protein
MQQQQQQHIQHMVITREIEEKELLNPEEKRRLEGENVRFILLFFNSFVSVPFFGSLE